jgi:prepilin-type N-terminal cleavage/methylation domain-containing protein
MHHLETHTLQRTDGFSLVEILTALVLVALVSSMAVPSMRSYVDRTNTRRALDQLVADISYARLLAVQQGKRTAVVIDDDGSYVINVSDNAGGWVTLKAVELNDEYEGVAVEGDLAALEFSSRGLLMTELASDGFIKIVRNGVRDSVFVSPAGRVYRAF